MPSIPRDYKIASMSVCNPYLLLYKLFSTSLVNNEKYYLLFFNIIQHAQRYYIVIT